MDVKFVFNLGDEVESREGIRGYVENNCVTRGMSVSRVGVEYMDGQGRRQFDWFNEDDLEFLPEDE